MFSDLKFACRSLLKTPGFTLVAVLTLAICIGANSAIFSIIDAILLKPYPWPGSDRLVYVYNTYPLIGLTDAGVSIPDYVDRRSKVSGFADSAMYTNENFNLAGAREPQRIAGLRATPSLFTTLQISAALGRVFSEDEAQPGREKVVVLSNALWKSRFGADPAIVGKIIRLNTEPVTVIGVMPAGFYFPSPNVQAWVPFAFTPADRSDRERGHEYSTMIARLKPAGLDHGGKTATLASIQRELDMIQVQNALRLPNEAPFWKSSGFGGRVAGYLEQNVENISGMLWLVQAGIGAALLIGCANVASLLLARALSRERELAIRAALGAGRTRLLRLLLTESLALFFVGGALGLFVALWSIDALNSLGVSTLPRAFGVNLDLTVFGFTILCSLIAGLIFGALPAWTAAQGNAATALKEAGARTTASRRSRRLRTALVVTEIALAVMLLSTAGLLVKSFERLQSQSPGFVAENVLTAKLSLVGPGYADKANRRALHARLLERAHSLPGVTAAAITSSLPLGGNFWQSSYDIDGYTPPSGQPQPHAYMLSVSPDYFRAMAIPLLRGRSFTQQDNEHSPDVVIIDRVLAERYWPGGDPIGRKIIAGNGPDTRPWTIVGVVAAAKNTSLEKTITKEAVYFPLAQSPDSDTALVLKTSARAELLVAPMRAAMAAIDPEQPLYDVKPLNALIDEALVTRHAPMVLLTIFSGVALLLASLGVYGVLAFSVAQRTSEFGIRLALGATPRDIATLVLGHGLRLVLVGVMVGLGGYLALSRIIGKLLYGVDATDPVMLALTPLVIAVVALVASILPARRAMKVDPMVALRAG